MRLFFRFVLRALVLLVVALVSALTAMRFAIHVGEVAVPNLLGKTPSEARKLAGEIGLPLDVERQYYSDQVPEGRIISQVPSDGTKVRRGWRVRVAESMGPQRLAIPSVVGQTERAAEMNIRRRGLELGSIAQLQMPEVPSDRVMSQSPPPNATGVAAPKISLLITDSPPPQSFIMPNFLGQPLGSVRLSLQDAGMKLGRITSTGDAQVSAASTPSPASLVTSQNPAPGEKIVAGGMVELEVR